MFDKQYAIDNWETIGKQITLDYLDQVVSMVEFGKLDKSLLVAVEWYNKFDRASMDGAIQYFNDAPKWMFNGG